VKSNRVLHAFSLATLLGLATLLVACGSSSAPLSSAPTAPVTTATTTLQAETSNNTSTADSFARQTNGNISASNVSKGSLQSLLYSGSNTKMYVTWLGWFGRSDHMNVGYNSGDSAQVHRQVQDMISRGVQGAIAAWYGSTTTSIETATQLLKSEAEANAGHFEFAIMEDVGALGSAAASNGCDVTSQLISDLTYVASQYESSPAYMRFNGRPVVFFFGVDAFYIDWSRVVSSIPGNPLLIFQGNSAFTRNPSEGGFSWVNVDSNNPFDPELTSQDSFYAAAQQASGRLAFGSAYKGFNDTLATWGTNRVIDQHCGQTWLQTFSEAGKFYSSSNQMPAMQIATWNDYEEGTAIEPGIDNCVYLTPSQSGTKINWSVNGGNEDTIDHYTVFISTDGTNLTTVNDVPQGTHSLDLSQMNLSSATYSVYVKATGVPSIQNKMSPAIAYHPGDQPPGVSLNISQTGSLTYSAAAAASTGSIARSAIDFGDGTVVNESSASHTYAAVGTYLVTAYVYDAAGASSVAVQQISVKATTSGIAIITPSDGSTVNWPTPLVASANPGTPGSVMRVLIDGQQAYAANGDTLNTALKIFTGKHQISVQSLDKAGNVTASTSLNIVAEPGDIPPVAKITVSALPNISPTTVLGCTATSSDPDGFLIISQVRYSDGSQFLTPAALETFPSPGTYTATLTVMDQFGATNSTSTTFSVGSGAPAVMMPSVALQQDQQPQQRPTQPIGPP
jgi:PKD domain